MNFSSQGCTGRPGTSVLLLPDDLQRHGPCDAGNGPQAACNGPLLAWATPNPCQANKLRVASASFQENLVNLIPSSIKRGKTPLFSQKSWGSWGREGGREPRDSCVKETQLAGQWPRTFHVDFQPPPGDSRMLEEPLIQTRCL